MGLKLKKSIFDLILKYTRTTLITTRPIISQKSEVTLRMNFFQLLLVTSVLCLKNIQQSVKLNSKVL